MFCGNNLHESVIGKFALEFLVGHAASFLAGHILYAAAKKKNASPLMMFCLMNSSLSPDDFFPFELMTFSRPLMTSSPKTDAFLPR